MFSELHETEVRTVKNCPPFVDAMAHGFTMPLPCDVTVEAGRLSWNWPIPELAARSHPRAPLAFHAPAQLEGSPFHQPGQVAIKFNCFWTIELEPGWSLFATHPVNRPDLPFHTLTGLVDADRFHDVGILFPALWVDRAFTGTLARGTPVAQCFPVPRQSLELTYETLTADDVARYDSTAAALLGGPGHYRKNLRAPRSAREDHVALDEDPPQISRRQPDAAG